MDFLLTLGSEELMEKAKTKKLLNVHLTEEAAFFVVQGKSSAHAVQIWYNGEFACSCSHHIYRSAICAHIIAALKALQIMMGEDFVKKIVEQHIRRSNQ